jgi:alpha-glucosidase
VFDNDDVTRLPTRYGGGEEGTRRARAAALLLLALPGTTFVYEGQELGLEEVDLPDEARRDPIFFRTKGGRKGRDGCRVPIPWESTPPGFGFTLGTPGSRACRARSSSSARPQMRPSSALSTSTPRKSTYPQVS